MSGAAKERVVLIGVGGVDWPSLRAVMRRGLVPNMSALAARGGLGSLQNTGPQIGVAPWTTMVTGHDPLSHGVYSESERWAGGLRATTRASWLQSPIWSKLAAAGIETASVGWPAIAPGDSWQGCHVDESFAAASGPSWDDWALPLRCVPAELREDLRSVRVHPSDIGAAQLLPLVPGLASIDQSRDGGLPMLAVGMAQTATIQAAAVYLIGRLDWQALFVHYPWLGRVRQGGVLAPPWDRVLDGAWRFLDGLVGHIVGLVGRDCTVLIASPGWEGATGVILATGPGIKPNREIASAQLFDLAPSVLSILGLRDDTLPGRTIVGLSVVSETRRVEDVSVCAAGIEQAGLARLAALGYTPPSAPPISWEVDRLLAKAVLSLASSPVDAAKVAEEALALMPDHVGALSLLARVHVMLGNLEPLPALGDAMLRLAPEHPCGSLIHGTRHALAGDAEAAHDWLATAAAAGDHETTLRVGAAWLMLEQWAEAEETFRSALARNPSDVVAAVGASMAACGVSDLNAAEKPLRQVLARDPQAVPAWLQLAEVMERSGRKQDAAIAHRNAAIYGGERTKPSV